MLINPLRLRNCYVRFFLFTRIHSNTKYLPNSSLPLCYHHYPHRINRPPPSSPCRLNYFPISMPIHHPYRTLALMGSIWFVDRLVCGTKRFGAEGKDKHSINLNANILEVVKIATSTSSQRSKKRRVVSL